MRLHPAALVLVATVTLTGCGSPAASPRGDGPHRKNPFAVTRLSAFAGAQPLHLTPAEPCPPDSAQDACYSRFVLSSASPDLLPANAASTAITLRASPPPHPNGLLVSDASNPSGLLVAYSMSTGHRRVETASFHAPSGLSNYLVTLKTAAGRRTYWLNVDSPQSLQVLRMFAGDTGFGGGGTGLFHTVDGGLKWSPIGPTTGLPTSSPFGFPIFSTIWTAIDPLHVWFAQEDAAQGGAQVSVFNTVDGGAVWSKTQFTVPEEYIGGLHLSFSDPEHGVLLATSTPAAGLMNKAVYVTSDGGQTFHEVSCSCLSPTDLPAGSYPTAIASISPQVLYVVGASHGSSYSWVYRSTDGGRTFARLNLPSAGPGYVSAWAPVFSGASGVLPAVLYGPKGLSFVTYITSNAGQTFKPGTPVPITNLSPDTNGPVYAFLSPMDGFVVAGASLEITTDGGATWTSTPLPSGIQRVGTPLVLAADGAGDIWLLAGSSAAHLFRSTDGGQTWSSVWPALTGP